MVVMMMMIVIGMVELVGDDYECGLIIVMMLIMIVILMVEMVGVDYACGTDCRDDDSDDDSDDCSYERHLLLSFCFCNH